MEERENGAAKKWLLLIYQYILLVWGACLCKHLFGHRSSGLGIIIQKNVSLLLDTVPFAESGGLQLGEWASEMFLFHLPNWDYEI